VLNLAIGFSPPHNERLFHCLDYRNAEAIQGMIRNYYKFYTIAEEKSNTELMVIYCDITNGIKECGLTDRQKQILQLYIDGDNYLQIAEKLHIGEQSVHQLVTRVCRRISKYLYKGERR